MAITYSDPDVDTDETTIQLAALTPTDNGVIIGNGSAFVVESGATARTSLGLAIGTDVQAYDADLATWSGVTPGTGIATALAVNVGTAGAPVINGGALGTPASGVLTNCTGLPNASVVGLGTAALKNTGTSGNNVPLLDGANTWSGQQTFSGAIQALFSASTPRTDYYETDGGSNGKLWSWIADTGVFYLQTRTDADVFGAAPIAITRSGTTVSSIALAATALSLSGVTSVTGATLSSPTLSGTVAGSPTFSGNPVYTGIPRLAAFYVGADSDMYIYESATNTLTLRAGGSGTETYLTIAPSGVVQIGGVNVMTVAGGTFTGNVTIENGDPRIYLKDTNASANNQVWLMYGGAGGALQFYTADDSYGASSIAMQIHRSGVTPGGVTIGSPTGGDKGAGTLNCVAAYDDNTLLTDLVLDVAAAGDFDRIKYANHPLKNEVAAWWFDPDQYAEFWKAERHLPGMLQFTPETKPSTGESITRLTAVVETQAALIEQLNQRLKAAGL